MKQDIWENYGFAGDPFDTSPLSFGEEASLPIQEAFIGRKKTKESRMLTNFLRNPGGGRLVIEGEVGVGKTSFVNYHRFLWEYRAQDKLFSTVEEISLCAHWELRHFLVNLLASVIDKLLSFDEGKELLQQSEILREIHSLSKVVFSSKQDYHLQIGWVGAGWGRGEDVYVPELPETQLLRYFRLMVREICKAGYAGMFFHLDNLDVVGKSSPRQLKNLFEKIRDVLQTPKVYFVFVGQKHLFSQIISPLPRVRSIFFGRPIWMPPLSDKQVVEVIHKRYDLLKRGKRYIKPIPDSFVQYLYHIYEGNIRFIMDSVQNIIQEINEDMPHTLDEKRAKKILKEILQDQLNRLLTHTERKILFLALDLERFTNSQLSRFSGIPTSNMSGYIKKLEELFYIQELSQEGRKKYYQVSPVVKLLKLKMSKLIQISPLSSSSKREIRQNKALQYLKKKGTIQCGDYQQLLEVSASTAIRDLKFLIEKGKIIKKGKGKKAYYELV